MTQKECTVGKQIENLPLPICFDQNTCEVILPPAVVCKGTSGKGTEKMRGVLRNPNYDREEAFYSFFEGIALKEDVPAFQEFGLRYDLISVRPGTADGEFKKTSGHYHSVVPGRDVSYPEIYEVLQGNALFMLQRCDSDGAVLEALAVNAKPGDKLVIPPQYGHATVNIGDEPLVFADLVATACSNTYGQIAQNHGMCSYVLKKDNGFEIVQNPAYGNPPLAKVVGVPENPDLSIWRDRPIYQVFQENPKAFDYLKDPVPYLNHFSKL